MASIEELKAASNLVKQHLIGEGDQPGVRQHIVKSHVERRSAKELHESFMDRVAEVIQIAGALANSAEVSLDELFRGLSHAETARDITSTTFDTPNAAGLRSATQSCESATQQLRDTSLAAMRAFADKLNPLLAACRDMSNAPAPIAPEADYRETAGTVTRAYEQILSYDDKLGR